VKLELEGGVGWEWKVRREMTNEDESLFVDARLMFDLDPGNRPNKQPPHHV
jgi:hypothetical protein